MRRALAFFILFFWFTISFAGSGWATPVQFNIEQMLKKAQEPQEKASEHLKIQPVTTQTL